ncbi:hypothetical protein BGW38_002545 [Lunasporangiospora selenospora]|uniref:Branchpoint-bridging protein n=1 Tax=Lunasporangiospora selenospora TaxID=979761 RepID=A0A9P6G2Y5_9FUNG|nr:hypothetical protein BGW38_002545 [Lunasporangiospora selenospora]
MWNPGKTGSNTTPLGPRKRVLAEMNSIDFEDRGRPTEVVDRSYSRYQNGGDIGSRDQPTSHVPSGQTSGTKISSGNSEDGSGEPRRKRKSRWAAEEEKVTIPGMPTTLPSNMSQDQLDLFLLHTRLEEISRKLRTGDVLPTDRERSPSPEPMYNSEGKRVNTREYRYRKRLEDERHQLIDGAVKKYPEFRPPSDYKRPSKIMDKVFIPVREFPEINFIGLLIGPRGNTLKKMETDSGAKISIRGKGSVKEGKSRSEMGSSTSQEEDLHCLVSADSEDKVTKAIQLINKIIETSASVPEGQNELKRMQLRELASLNGTLRDDENQTCLNCGGLGHRKYECPEIHNVTINLVCGICGGHGHATRDCRDRNNPEAAQKSQLRNQKIDSEYLNLMAELGEQVPSGAAPSQPKPDRESRDGSSGHYGPSSRGPSGSRPPPPWATNSPRESSSYGSTPPPWAARAAATAAAHASPAPPSSSPAPWHQHGAPGAASSTVPPWQQHANAPPPPPSSSNPWNTPASDAGAPPPPSYPGAQGYQYNPYPGYYSGYSAPPPPPPMAPPGIAPGMPPPPPPSLNSVPPPPPPSQVSPPPPPASQPPPPPPPIV